MPALFGPYPYDPADGHEPRILDPEQQSFFPGVHESGAIANPERAEAFLGKQVVRGSSWRSSRDQARCAYRSWAAPMHRSDDTGFRLVYE